MVQRHRAFPRGHRNRPSKGHLRTFNVCLRTEEAGRRGQTLIQLAERASVPLGTGGDHHE